MNFLKSITYIPIIASLLFLSCGNPAGSITVKNWNILYDQNESLDKIKKTDGWQPFEIPSIITLPYKPDSKFQFVWLRGKAFTGKSPEKYYGISTGRLKFSDTIYINGSLIGSRPPDKINWTPQPRNYEIPRNVLHTGENIIHIRLGIYGKSQGGILGDVLIQPEDEFEMTRFTANLIYRQIPLGIVILFITFSIVLLITYIQDRREKIFLYSIAPLLISSIYIYLPLSPFRVISFEFFSAMLYSLVPVFSIIFILLFQAIYRIYISNYNRIIFPLFIFFIIIIFLFRDEEINNTISIMTVLVTLLIAVPFTAFLIYKLYSINKDKFLLSMTGLMAFLAFSIIIFEIYFGFTEALHSELIEIFIPPAFLIIGTIVSSREMIKRKKELEGIYEKLHQLESKELSISDTLEKKLNRLIEFINANYRSNLSREGMAAAIGIHPNYLGRLFKSYTGKKISEYINNLRIQDAVKQLEDKNASISDIAYSVGFESHATFNRVFKSIMGKIPSDYRIKA